MNVGVRSVGGEDADEEEAEEESEDLGEFEVVGGGDSVFEEGRVDGGVLREVGGRRLG